MGSQYQVLNTRSQYNPVCNLHLNEFWHEVDDECEYPECKYANMLLKYDTHF